MLLSFIRVSYLKNNTVHCFYCTVESFILIKSIVTKLTDKSVYICEKLEGNSTHDNYML